MAAVQPVIQVQPPPTYESIFGNGAGGAPPASASNIYTNQPPPRYEDSYGPLFSSPRQPMVYNQHMYASHPIVYNQQPLPYGYETGQEEHQVSNNNSKWMSRPQIMTYDCPPGLEYLAELSCFTISSGGDYISSRWHPPTAERTLFQYQVKNPSQKLAYLAFADFDDKSAPCLCFEDSNRFSTLHVVDQTSQEVIRLVLPDDDNPDYRFFRVEVASIGETIATFKGYSSEGGDEIRDAHGHSQLRILEEHNFLSTNDFHIHTIAGDTIGSILHERGFFGSDMCVVYFPKDLQVKLKAAILCKAFMINITTFYATRYGTNEC